MKKLESWYGKSKFENIAQNYKQFKNLKQKENETIIDFIQRFEDSKMKLASDNASMPEAVSYEHLTLPTNREV